VFTMDSDGIKNARNRNVLMRKERTTAITTTVATSFSHAKTGLPVGFPADLAAARLPAAAAGESGSCPDVTGTASAGVSEAPS